MEVDAVIYPYCALWSTRCNFVVVGVKGDGSVTGVDQPASH